MLGSYPMIWDPALAAPLLPGFLMQHAQPCHFRIGMG